MSRGKAIVNLLDLTKGEQVAAILAVKDFSDGKYIVMATKKGIVKKTELVSYSHPRSAGIVALKIREGDELIGVRVTSGDDDIFSFQIDIQFHHFTLPIIRIDRRFPEKPKRVNLKFELESLHLMLLLVHLQ